MLNRKKKNIRPGTLLRWYSLKNILKSEVKDGSLVLDIGGYDGFISCNLKKIFPCLKITVVDLDKLGLKIAKELGLNTLNASVLKLPITDSQVDIVICLDLIEHIEEDDQMLKEISRVLKKGGKIILTTPGQNGVSFPFMSKRKIEFINKSWGHVREGYSIKRIEHLFLSNGLNIEKTSSYFNSFTRFIYRFMILSRIPLLGKELIYKSVLKLEPFLKYGAQEHIILGRKQ